MTHRTLFYTQAAILLCIAIFHAFALMNDLYWYYPLFNRLIHFSGGVWVALASVWLLVFQKRELNFSRVMGLVILVSIAWEIFEVAIGMTSEPNYALDTALDLLMDVCGGVTGFVIAKRMVDLYSNGEVENSSS